MKYKISGKHILPLLLFLVLFSYLSSPAQNAKTTMLIYQSGAVIFERDIAAIDSVKFYQSNSATFSVPIEELFVYRDGAIYFRKDITQIDSITFFKTGEIQPLIVAGTISPTVMPGCSPSAALAVSNAAELESLPGTLSINQGCSGKDKMTVTHTDVVSGNCPIIINRTYTIMDACNNMASVVHRITIEDTTKPIITGTLADVTATGSSIASAPSAALTVAALELLPGAIRINDNCTNQSNLTVIHSDEASGVCPIVINRTYTITDACGSSASTVQKITIQPNAIISKNAVFIPAGSFVMGSPDSEKKWGNDGNKNDESLHQVTLNSFYMSKYEVSNAEFATFLNNKNIGADALCREGVFQGRALINNDDSRFEPWGVYYIGDRWIPYAGFENHPVVFVTWYGAVEYATYVGGRLPTEAEWEYACRAGTITPFNTGFCLTDLQANYDWKYPYDNCTNTLTSPWKTRAVNSYATNAWGLYNMHGNVYDWCSDWYGDYSKVAQTNPIGSLSGYDKVIRGGGNSNVAHQCRSAYRNFRAPGYASSTIGIRVAFDCTASN